MGRWLNRDPIGDAAFSYFQAGSFVRYSYAFLGNSSLINIDSYGLEKFKCVRVHDMNALETSWRYMGVVPGTRIGGSNAMGDFYMKAVALRRFRQMYRCCDANDTQFWTYGGVGVQFGEFERLGDNKYAAEAIDVTWTWKLPVPWYFGGHIGIKIPKVRFTLAAKFSDENITWPGSAPTTYTPGKLIYPSPEVTGGYEVVKVLRCNCKKKLPWKQRFPTWPGGFDASF